MNKEILNKHIEKYLEHIKNNGEIEDLHEREQRKKFYSSYSKDIILSMDRDELFNYFEKLWAMLMWGNKRYKVEQLINDNGFKNLKEKLSELLYGDKELEIRWDEFNANIKGIGPAIMSELLCYVYPNECMLWNRTTINAFTILDVANVPIYYYQMSGKRYVEMTRHAKEIQQIFKNRGYEEADLLFVDFFCWDQLRDINKINECPEVTVVNNKRYHKEIVEYIKSIGEYLGYDSRVSGKIKNSGKIADAVWEFNVGNIGKLKYVFEVQDNGSVDSLAISLMNASQDPSVQSVVAVSDKNQIELIKKHCKNIQVGFSGKLHFWNITEIEQVYQELSSAMTIINKSINEPTSF